MHDSEDQLNQLVDSVLQSPKYKNVCEELIRHIGARELAARRGTKAAVKATKNKLHQVGGAYLGARIDYARGLDEVRQATASNDDAGLRQVCKRLMRLHASTRERVEILEAFYAATLSQIKPARVILDVACGLNPLAIPWMPLHQDAMYYAYDIYTDMVAFVREFLAIMGVGGYAEARDVIQSPPTQPADLALILKTIPCLEQIDKTAGLYLLEALNADHVLVSFPVSSLSGQSKGMVENYEARFNALVQGKPWVVQRFQFPTELAFLVIKRSEHTRNAERH
jgi:16S rRNA (guanine(1405)-N(7))-methyltransferase